MDSAGSYIVQKKVAPRLGQPYSQSAFRFVAYKIEQE